MPDSLKHIPLFYVSQFEAARCCYAYGEHRSSSHIMRILSCLAPSKTDKLMRKATEISTEKPQVADCGTQTAVPDVSWLKQQVQFTIFAATAVGLLAATMSRDVGLQYL